LRRVFIRNITIVLILVFFLHLQGCEAFRKKFIRKPKNKKKVEEEIVLEPQEYPESIYDNPTLYKNYYTFWKASHLELIISLEKGNSYKKQLFLFDEVLKNLKNMKRLLTEEKQEEMDYYIQEITDEKEKLSSAKLKDSLLPRLKSKLSSIEKKIRINFSYRVIREWIRD
jgi:hypothetical protein